MEKMGRARYTLEYKLEALRLMGVGQSIAGVAATLGLADLDQGAARRQAAGPGAKPVSADQMELSIIKKAAAYFARESV